MKTYHSIIIFVLSLFVLSACDQNYIDGISKVDPGADQTAPVVNIISPAEDYEIKVPDLVSPVTIEIEVTDDIELGTISVKFDGTEIKSYSGADFTDYRRALKKYVYENVALGDHVITVTATDLEGKSTSKSVNFAKVSPYTKKYADEVFYMPFEGDFMEMISFQNAGVVGNPGFADGGLQGSKAYAGATDSYLTYSMDNFKFSEFTIGLWVKINASPGNAGILTVGTTNDDSGRKNGFRLFREGSASAMRIKLNVGVGTGESWNDGDVINTQSGDWVHVAFSVTPTENTIYINGVPVRTAVMSGPIDWTGCTNISIGSGDPSFTYWGHKSDLSNYDDLRIFSKALSAEEIQTVIGDDSPYIPKYDGEIFYMPFEENAKDRVSNMSATIVGSPSWANGKVGKAYAGAADSYLTFPTDGLKNNAFSAAFWMKVNASPDRAGILVMGPEDTENAGYPDVQNNRKSGFRFFREGSSTAQIFKLNAGNGTADSWFDGGASATVDPTTGDWAHFAFTISGSQCVVYINGEIAKEGSFGGIDWTGCDLLSIMSGVPRFTEWNHKSDLSLIDELRLFNKALTQAEIQAIWNAEK
ncbi:MAG: LamG domain-containing protein [Mangrovibacterium sp.]